LLLIQAFSNIEKKKRAAELIVANTELTFQNKRKENRAELAVANRTYFQNEEKRKTALSRISCCQ
jgi:ABC-type transport system involved in cytochrome bd biosynthesis fused ATPase/permease subunit